MPVKYQCTKCGRRYVEWGAEKLNFVCTCSEDAELVRAGSPEDKTTTRKPSLKRTVSRRPAPAARATAVSDDTDNDEVAETDEGDTDDVIEADDEEEVEDDDEEEASEAVAEVEDDSSVDDDLDTDDDEDSDSDDDDDDDEFGDDDGEVESVEDLNFDDIAKPIGSDKLHDAPDDEWSN